MKDRPLYLTIGVLILVAQPVSAYESAQEIITISCSPFSDTFPVVSINESGSVIVVWQSINGRDGDGDGVFGRRYDNSGNPVGSEFQVNTYTTSHQREPSVAIDENGNVSKCSWLATNDSTIGWTNLDFNDSEWNCSYDEGPYDASPWNGAGELSVFSNYGARWIWTSPGTWYLGVAYFRKTFYNSVSIPTDPTTWGNIKGEYKGK